MKKFFSLTFIIIPIICSISCQKFIEVRPPSNKLSAATVFTTDATALAAVNGLYAQMSFTINSFSCAGSATFLGLYADELATTLTTSSTLEFESGSLSVTNGSVYTNFWQSAYQLIYIANSCIAGLQEATINPSLRTQLLGEAYFIRAYSYWTLVNLFGDIPLVLTIDDYENVALMSRTPFDEVINQIVIDLSDAKGMLQPDYPSSGRFRVNYYTAAAMLSRVNTFLGKWDEVLVNSNEVISNPIYTIEYDFNKIFLIESTEAIWQTATDQPFYNSMDGLVFVPSTLITARPSYTIQSGLFSAFSEADQRKVNWIRSKTVSGITYLHPYKYKIRQLATKTECQMMFRLAEIYLNRAEAKVYLDEDDLTALDDLNVIRKRAGLEDLSGLKGQSLVEAILQERRLELFAEWGLRFFDLKRTGKLDAILTPLKPDWKSTAVLFPIPQNERLVAPNLTQNPGYHN